MKLDPNLFLSIKVNIMNFDNLSSCILLILFEATYLGNYQSRRFVKKNLFIYIFKMNPSSTKR